MKISKLVPITILLLLLIANLLFAHVWCECSSDDCEYSCSVMIPIGECMTINNCCCYCTEDKGHTKEWCCLACGFEKV